MPLEVVDHRRAAWFLLAEDDALFLDCHCNHSAFGYSVLIELDADERARLEADGAAYLDELADAVHMSAPPVNHGSPYRARALEKVRGSEVGDAVRRWRAQRGRVDPANAVRVVDSVRAPRRRR